MIRRWIVYCADRETLQIASAHMTQEAAENEAGKRAAASGETYCFIEQVLPAAGCVALRYSPHETH